MGNISQLENPMNTYNRQSTKVLAVIFCFFCVYLISPTNKQIINKAAMIVPLLKGIPRELTKNSSEAEKRRIVPGPKNKKTKRRIPTATKWAIIKFFGVILGVVLK